METPGYFVITAKVDVNIWERFNDWYDRVHMPDAAARLGAANAFRLHQIDEAHVHVAVYEFADIAIIDSAGFKQALKALVCEFNSAWPSGVERKRRFYKRCIGTVQG